VRRGRVQVPQGLQKSSLPVRRSLQVRSRLPVRRGRVQVPQG